MSSLNFRRGLCVLTSRAQPFNGNSSSGGQISTPIWSSTDSNKIRPANASIRHCHTTSKLHYGTLAHGSLLTVKVDDDQQRIEIKGVIDAVPKKIQHISIPLVWLRDHCKCNKCYNYTTFQRQTNPLHLFDSLGHFPYSIKDACITQDKLTIIWSDDHISQYLTSYLCAAHTRELKFPTEQSHHKELWDSEKMEAVCASGVLNVDYDRIMDHRTRPTAISQLYRQLLTYGIGCVQGVPCDDNGKATFDLCGLVCVKMTTIYGSEWVFSSKNMDKEDTAYTSAELGAHTDGTYYGRSPGVQVLHCLKQAETGGQTLLVDGFHVAQSLHHQDPESYFTLTKLVVPHQFTGQGDHLLNDHMSVIRLKSIKGHDELEQIRYNPYDRSTMIMSYGNYGINDFEQFYRAYHKFAELVQQPDNEHWVTLQPGTVLFMDNWRILHGRGAYKGDRVMCGCYLTRDDFLSKARTLKVY